MRSTNPFPSSSSSNVTEGMEEQSLDAEGVQTKAAANGSRLANSYSYHKDKMCNSRRREVFLKGSGLAGTREWDTLIRRRYFWILLSRFSLVHRTPPRPRQWYPPTPGSYISCLWATRMSPYHQTHSKAWRKTVNSQTAPVIVRSVHMFQRRLLKFSKIQMRTETNKYKIYIQEIFNNSVFWGKIIIPLNPFDYPETLYMILGHISTQYYESNACMHFWTTSSIISGD